MEVKTKTLLAGLSVINKAIDANPTWAVLNNILLDFNDNKLKLSATNTKIAISFSLAASGNSFSTTVPAKVFTNLISVIGGEYVNLEYNKEKQVILVKTENSKNKIKCLDKELFPDIQPFIAENVLEMDANGFKRIIKGTSFCASSSNESPILTGINFENINGELAVIATNSFRFSRYLFDIPDELENFSVTIPSEYLASLAEASGEFIAMAFFENKILFKTKNIEASILALNGEYPKLRDFVIKIQNVAEIKTIDFYKACKQVAIFTSSDKPILNFNVGNIIKIFAEEKEIGDSQVDLEAIDFRGNDFNTTLNSKYLLDFLSVVDTNEICFSAENENSPVTFWAKGSNYVYTIMPIRA